MSEKIKVLVLPSDKTGVSKFRSVDPHVMLQNMYNDDFHVDIDYEPKINDRYGTVDLFILAARRP
jgi:hypothetical protein